ncbi:MAG: AbrB family transcriptional regulator [Defluviitaleaceae bacterium]|nr:AbrB family transcriptional regulator [Defluviitaleaceae bacterium]
METFLMLIVTITIGIIGGVGAKKLKFIPAAYMLGALLLVTVWNLTVGFAFFPQELRVATQILAGTYLGLSIDKSNLYSIRTLIKPISIILTLFFINALVFGYIVHRFFGTDLVTALYSFAPGGVAEMAIIADSFGADAGMITAMQLLRLITAFTFYPFLFQILEKKGIIQTNRKDEPQKTPEKLEKSAKIIDVDLSRQEKIKGCVIALSFSSIGGIIGLISGVPAGAMVFAMASGVMVNIFYPKAYMPLQMRFMAQIMAGIFLGMRITPESVEGITRSGGPALVMVLSMISVPLLIGCIVHKLTKMKLGTSLFCSTPGGMSEMSLLAKDMGFDFMTVSITHLARIIAVIIVFPQLINLFLRIIPG